MSKEGYSTILGVLLFSVAALVLGFVYHHLVLYWIAGVGVLLLGFVMYFFRDPQRMPPSDNRAIISPADGKILHIEEVKERLFFDEHVQKISIFMTVFDVHVNYTPCAGKVDFIQFKKGRFFPAHLDDASLHNVSCMTGLETEFGKIAVKQLTGLVARRIVNRLRYDDVVTAGQKFGIIKFGSRVEVYLPLAAKIAIKAGDRVRAGETVLATV